VEQVLHGEPLPRCTETNGQARSSFSDRWTDVALPGGPASPYGRTPCIAPDSLSTSPRLVTSLRPRVRADVARTRGRHRPRHGSRLPRVHELAITGTRERCDLGVMVWNHLRVRRHELRRQRREQPLLVNWAEH